MVTKNYATREDATDNAISMLKNIEYQHNLKPKTISIDKEFMTKDFERFAEENSINIEVSTPKQSHENGVAERSNRTLAGLLRLIISYKNLQSRF